MTSEQGEVREQGGPLVRAGEELDPSRRLRFEDPCFDPAFYINTRFPNEESFLSGGVSSTEDESKGSSLLDLHIESLKIEIQQVDSCILDAVRRQSASGKHAREQLHAAHATIRKAMSQVEEMKVKAAEHEQMVERVCKDIRQLDNAKKNLTAAITGLRRLGMLIDAVNQLQIAAEKRNFKEAGSLLGAVKQLLSHFVPSYSHIAKIAELKGRINALEQSLRLASLREFELLGEDAPPQHVVQVLKDCCAVTGAIGTSARDELVDIICRREMNMYTQIFGTVGETAKLERTVNRYKWFIRRLDSRSIIWSIFPEEWRVTQLLALTYCSITKSELAQILAEADADVLSRDVDGLLKAIEATHVFEAEMTRRFFVEQSSEEHEDDLDDEFFGEESRNDNSLSTSDLIRKKYQNTSIQAVDKQEKRALMEGAAEAAVKHASFKNSISPVFEPYMFIYIDDVTRSLSHRLETSIVSEKWIAMSDDQQILKSSDALTSMIREELKHCSTKISRGSTLIELGKVFRNLYQSYASALVSKLPKTSSGKTSGVAVVGSTAWHIKMTTEDIRVIILIINTSDHCIKMIGQLESAIEKRLQDSFRGKVDIGDAEDAFNDVITQSLSVLLLGIETKLDIPLAMLMRKNWQAFDMTGDQSDFTVQACAILKDLGRDIRPPSLSMNYFTYFCDKLIRSFAPRIFDALFKCGPISQAGGQQLRLDLEAYRAAFISLAKEGSLLSTRAPEHEITTNEPMESITKEKTWAETFALDVTTAFRTSESVLKVVSSPLGSVADTLLELMPGASSTDLQHILELMGIKKADMTHVIDVFCTKKDEIGTSKSRISKPLPAPTFSHGLAINNPTAHSFVLPTGAAAKASAAAQDMALHISRIRSSANAQAAKFSAAMKRDSGTSRSN